MTDVKNKINQLMPIGAQAYECIRESIVKLKYAPGQALSEQLVSSDLGISRTPVREVFIQLKKDGLVDIYSQRGTYVSYINIRRITEAFFTRTAIETAIIRELAEVIDQNGLELLDEIIIKQEESHIREEFFEYDTLLHKSFYNLTDHQVVWSWMNNLTVDADRCRYLDLANGYRIDELIVQHRQIVGLIKGKKVDLAVEMLEEHLNEIHETINKLKRKYPEYFIE